MLLPRFFRVFAHWTWPNPVMLSAIEHDDGELALCLPVWDPRRNPRDHQGRRRHLQSRKEIIKAGGTGGWGALFQPFHFFNTYKNYLQVDVTATGGDDDLRKWKGWVESRLRLLAARAETDMSGMLLCHLHPHAYAAEPHDQRRTSSFFVGLSKHKHQPAAAPQRPKFDLRATTDGFKQEVYMYDFWRPGMELTVAHVQRKHLPSYVLRQLHSAGHQLKRKHTNDASLSSSSPAASDDSNSNSSSIDAKKAATSDRIRSVEKRMGKRYLELG
ncbi:hypothetical protein GUJ93_ZPchr0004g39086 [Zizania palustris]|uniref:polynucleotide adenylyltransferase n=1 Tax=Zizania palustris TaxID=103762 RepID=A0A8J5S0N7_ZIZPA|nr:hypothetical protein GUJ93_ZPchr0004g39086 [Zizania palustris]